MIVYKNKSLGKGFIFLEKTGNDVGLFITTPDKKGEVTIKSLKLDLFTDESLEDEDEILLSDDAITKKQLLRFQQYKKERSDEIIDNSRDAFEQLTPWQQKELIAKLMKGK